MTFLRRHVEVIYLLKLYSSNNVISYDGTVTLDNVSSDTPISLKLVQMSFISIKNNTYGYNTVISFNVTDSQGLSQTLMLLYCLQ